MIKRLVRAMQKQGLTVTRRYVAGIDNADLEHSQTNDEYLCGLFVKNVAGKTATAIWHATGPVRELFVISEDRVLETHIMDAFAGCWRDPIEN